MASWLSFRYLDRAEGNGGGAGSVSTCMMVRVTGNRHSRSRSWRVLCLLGSLSLLAAFLPLRAAQDTTSFDDLVSQASAARTGGDLPRAIALYQRAVQLNPQWGQGWWSLGLLQYETNAYPAARDSLTQYLELAPSAGPGFALRGLCEFETGQYDESLKDMQQGMSLGAANRPKNEQILRYHIALLLTRTGHFQEAVQQYAWFAKDGITSPEMLLGLGAAGLHAPVLPQDVPLEARELFTAAGSAAYQFLAGHLQDAQEAFDNLFRRFPAAANGHYLYGFLLMQTDPDSAIDQFKEELKVSPSNANADVMLAWLYLLQNDPAHALPYAQAAFAAQPSASVSLLVLGRSLVRTGELKRGTEYLEKALQIDPGDIEIHIALAHAYAEEGRKEDAWHERMLSIQIARRTKQGENP